MENEKSLYTLLKEIEEKYKELGRINILINENKDEEFQRNSLISQGEEVERHINSMKIEAKENYGLEITMENCKEVVTEETKRIEEKYPGEI
jgi:hypothetical protein